LAYHSIKSKASHICDGCVDDDRRRDKTCFLCGKTYTDEQGVVRDAESSGGLSPLITHAANTGKDKSKKATLEGVTDEDEAAAYLAAWKEKNADKLMPEGD